MVLRLIVLCSVLAGALVVWTSPALGATPEAATFEVRPVPAWVTPVTPVISPASKAASDGTDYLLLDRQENLDPRASFYHEARLIFSDTGVQNGSSVSVVFDPAYEKLSIHFVRLIRSGITSDRLDPSRVKLYQRETDLENFLYDGRFTAECQLEDVRAGDVIEYAYTLEGSNPVLAGHYADGFSTSWSCPVHRVVSRVVHPASHNLFFKIRNRGIHPVMTTREGVSEWVWDESNIAARPKDPQTPRGYDPYGKVWVTDFADWAAVVDWALPLYQVKQPLPAELEFRQSAPSSTPAEDASFDLVYSWSAFEHIGDPVGVLREIRRIIRPGGVFFLQLWPFYHSAKGSHLWDWFEQDFHHLLAGEREIVEQMRASDRHDGGWTEYMAREFEQLNRVTLGELQRAVLTAGFDVRRLELLSSTVLLTPELARYSWSDLGIGGIKLLAAPRL